MAADDPTIDEFIRQNVGEAPVAEDVAATLPAEEQPIPPPEESRILRRGPEGITTYLQPEPGLEEPTGLAPNAPTEGESLMSRASPSEAQDILRRRPELIGELPVTEPRGPAGPGQVSAILDDLRQYDIRENEYRDIKGMLALRVRNGEPLPATSEIVGMVSQYRQEAQLRRDLERPELPGELKALFYGGPAIALGIGAPVFTARLVAGALLQNAGKQAAEDLGASEKWADFLGLIAGGGPFTSGGVVQRAKQALGFAVGTEAGGTAAEAVGLPPEVGEFVGAAAGFTAAERLSASALRDLWLTAKVYREFGAISRSRAGTALVSRTEPVQKIPSKVDVLNAIEEGTGQKFPALKEAAREGDRPSPELHSVIEDARSGIPEQDFKAMVREATGKEIETTAELTPMEQMAVIDRLSRPDAPLPKPAEQDLSVAVSENLYGERFVPRREDLSPEAALERTRADLDQMSAEVKPSSWSTRGEAGAASSTSPAERVSSLTQPLEGPSQVSTQQIPSESGSPILQTEPRANFGRRNPANMLGVKRPTSAHIVSQPLRNLDEIFVEAEKRLPDAENLFRDLASEVPGVEVFSGEAAPRGLRVKTRTEAEAKIRGERLKGGAPRAPREADEVSDYLGGRLSVDPENQEALIAALRRRGRIVEDHDFTFSPNVTGYRARHIGFIPVDAKGEPAWDVSVEIQIAPKEIQAVQERAHEPYTKLKKPGYTREEMAAAVEESAALYQSAWEQHLDRVGMGRASESRALARLDVIAKANGIEKPYTNESGDRLSLVIAKEAVRRDRPEIRERTEESWEPPGERPPLEPPPPPDIPALAGPEPPEPPRVTGRAYGAAFGEVSPGTRPMAEIEGRVPVTALPEEGALFTRVGKRLKIPGLSWLGEKIDRSIYRVFGNASLPHRERAGFSPTWRSWENNVMRFDVPAKKPATTIRARGEATGTALARTEGAGEAEELAGLNRRARAADDFAAQTAETERGETEILARMEQAMEKAERRADEAQGAVKRSRGEARDQAEAGARRAERDAQVAIRKWREQKAAANQAERIARRAMKEKLDAEGARDRWVKERPRQMVESPAGGLGEQAAREQGIEVPSETPEIRPGPAIVNEIEEMRVNNYLARAVYVYRLVREVMRPLQVTSLGDHLGSRDAKRWEALADYVETGGRITPEGWTTLQVQGLERAAKGWRRLDDDLFEMIQRAGIKAEDLAGNVRDVGYVANHWPRHWEDDFWLRPENRLQALTFYEAEARRLGNDPETARKMAVDSLYGFRFQKGRLRENLHARGPVGVKGYMKNGRALVEYADNVFGKAFYRHHFGADNERVLPLLAAIRENDGQEAFEYVDKGLAAVAGLSEETAGSELARQFQTVAGLSKLFGLQFLQNYSEHTFTAGLVGWRNVWPAFKKSWKGPAKQLATDMEDTARDLNEIALRDPEALATISMFTDEALLRQVARAKVQYRPKGEIGMLELQGKAEPPFGEVSAQRISRGLAHLERAEVAALRANFFTQSSDQVRRTAAGAAMLYFDKNAKVLVDEGMGSPAGKRAAQALREWGLDPDRVVLYRGLDPIDRIKAAVQVGRTMTGKYEPENFPLWARSGYGSTIYTLHRWSSQSMKRVWNYVIHPIMIGQPGAWARFGQIFASSLISGEAYRSLKAVTKGLVAGVAISKILSGSDEDYRYRPASIGWRLMEDMSVSFGLGFFGDTARSLLVNARRPHREFREQTPDFLPILFGDMVRSGELLYRLAAVAKNKAHGEDPVANGRAAWRQFTGILPVLSHFWPQAPRQEGAGLSY